VINGFGLPKTDLDMIGKYLSEEIECLAGAKLFITGGTGFFGKWILNAIAYLNDAHGFNICTHVLSRNPKVFLSENIHIKNRRDIKFIEGDIASVDRINYRFDFVIHAAGDAIASRYGASQNDLCDSMAAGARAIAALAERCGVRRIFSASSGAAYGDIGDIRSPIEETARSLPGSYINDYGRSKKISEDIFLSNKNFETVIGRCFTFCGPYLPINGPYAFGNFVGNILENKEIIIRSDGSSVRSYMYASDLVVWILKIMARGVNGSVFNIGNDRPISIKDLACEFSRIFDLRSPQVQGIQGGGQQYYVPSIAKAKQELGLQIYTDLDNAIMKTVNFYKGKVRPKTGVE
jgi:nucleoside-diphosphate-sugar epimerase